ncbi:RNA methyltransferase [Euzebyella marina]|uniref:RNA methyltransferase n=1 Tax=Euzebyella marina TaxID=1761453 RepID=A0A3G2L3X4_9FLAO|nr:RNA methyltransferase [Euzebyella marina]AYN66933.1 RNA methyltransferase [Euzebyella marina]
MIVKSQIKLIRSLHQKKYRNQLGLFFVEGRKTINELLTSRFELNSLYETEEGLIGSKDIRPEIISQDELKKISALTTPSGCLAVFKIPEVQSINSDNWIVALDEIRDPGNLGTIIRLCDWFGVTDLVCSANTVDCYNPKTVQASMGSLARVNVGYTDLSQFLANSDLPVYGAFMEGHSVYKSDLPEKAVLVMGNEANGISPEIESLISDKIAIPQFGKQSTESLNVATASAILLSEIRRR